MKSRLNLKPGRKGTKKLVEEYGDSLLYVRYRYDETRGVRLKTVEIVVEEKPWQPSVFEPGIHYRRSHMRTKRFFCGCALILLIVLPYKAFAGSQLVSGQTSDQHVQLSYDEQLDKSEAQKEREKRIQLEQEERMQKEQNEIQKEREQSMKEQEKYMKEPDEPGLYGICNGPNKPSWCE